MKVQDFDPRDYLRLNQFPHFLCPGRDRENAETGLTANNHVDRNPEPSSNLLPLLFHQRQDVCRGNRFAVHTVKRFHLNQFRANPFNFRYQLSCIQFRDDDATDAIELDGVRSIIVPELNAGQLVTEIERICPELIEVKPLNRVDGEAIPPADILSLMKEQGEKVR